MTPLQRLLFSGSVMAVSVKCLLGPLGLGPLRYALYL